MAIQKLTQHPRHSEKGLGSDGRSRLRNWHTPSYDNANGRAAKSSMEEQSSASFDRGERGSFNRDQVPTCFDHIDGRRTQNMTPVAKRRFSEVHE
jgi:hypothetical protein